MAGREVTRQQLDIKSAEAVISVREAMDKVEAIFKFLETVPSNTEGGDPLTRSTDATDPEIVPGKFGYNADEAYLIRFVIEGLRALPTQPLLDAGRKLSGLD